MMGLLMRLKRNGHGREARQGGRGQSILEYSILIAIVAAAFIAMSMYVRRAVQGRITEFDDQISGKPKGTQTFVGWATGGTGWGADSGSWPW